MILIFGKHGQLAQSLAATLPKELEGKTVFVSSFDANFEKPDLLEGYLDHQSPEIIILCSAYTQVDKAEEERHLAEALNVKAPQAIARWCGKNGALLIHFSTDYVYSGEGDRPWKETDPTAPLNWYGETKLEGEEAIRASGCPHLIFRTSWIYSEYGKNFVKTMLKLGKEKDLLRVVADQKGSPTYAPDIADVVWTLVQRQQAGERLKSGVYHLAGQGITDWAEFAQTILLEARKLKFTLKTDQVERIPTREYATPAQRPLNSRLDQSKLKETFGIELPPWVKSLELCLKRIGAS